MKILSIKDKKHRVVLKVEIVWFICVFYDKYSPLIVCNYLLIAMSIDIVRRKENDV